MDLLANYLSKFKNLTPPERFIRECFCESVKEVVGVSLDQKAVSVKGRTAYITAPHALKTELFTQKHRILTLVNQKTGGKSNSLSDIR